MDSIKYKLFPRKKCEKRVVLKNFLDKKGWQPMFSEQFSNERNCGQHCVSMITHIPVDVICSFFEMKKGTKTEDVVRMLWWFGVECDFKKTKGSNLPELCIVHTGHHWHVYFEGYVFDSCAGIFNIKIDKRRIKGFIRVTKPI